MVRNAKGDVDIVKYTIVIGSDNAAVDLKNVLIDFLRKNNVNVEDVGCFSKDDSIYYPDVAANVCKAIINSGYKKKGVLVCGTGIGMSIAANKFFGIRAALCHDNFSAERSVLSNNCNVLCMGERVIGHELAKKILGEWIKLTFKDGPSTPKIEAIVKIEEQNMKVSGDC